MFNFVRKTLLTITTATTTTNYYNNFAIPVFIRCISTTTSKEDSFTVSYLMNSCGFSLESALSASKFLYLNSRENADSVIALLKSHSFSQTQISKLIRVCPVLLSYSSEKTLLPKFQFLYSKGLSSSDLAKISSAYPNLLERSLEKHIIPSVNYLSDLCNSSETAIASIKCNPYILDPDVETYLGPRINVLRDIGMSERNILFLLKRWRRPSRIDFLEAVKEMGISPLKSQFSLAVHAKLYGETNWEGKVDVYRRWGLSEEELLAAFRVNPLFMSASKDKIMAVMDFLVNKMDIESSAIVKYPDIIGLSLEKRFIPRAAVFQFLLSKGLIKRKRNNTNLITLFRLPEKAFVQNFVNSYDGAPEILKLYQEKLAVPKMRKTIYIEGE